MQTDYEWLEAPLKLDNSPTDSSPMGDNLYATCQDAEIVTDSQSDACLSFDYLYQPAAHACDCLGRVLKALTPPPASPNDPQSNNPRQVNIKTLDVVTATTHCNCFNANDTLFYLVTYAVAQVLTTYAAEAARLSFEASMCTDDATQEKAVHSAQATLMFGELPRALHIIDVLAKPAAAGQRHGVVDDLRQRFGQTRRAVWDSIQPLNTSWSEALDA